MERGDIFLIGEIGEDKENSIIDTTAMYTYICEHPWNEFGANKLCCNEVVNTSDTTPRWRFLSMNGKYTVIAKHEDQTWVRQKGELMKIAYDSEEFCQFAEKMREANPETKALIMSSMTEKGIGAAIEKQKMLEFAKKTTGEV